MYPLLFLPEDLCCFSVNASAFQSFLSALLLCLLLLSLLYSRRHTSHSFFSAAPLFPCRFFLVLRCSFYSLILFASSFSSSRLFSGPSCVEMYPSYFSK